MSTTLTPGARILRPDNPGWDVGRRAWNLAVDQHPAAVAVPESAADVAAAISFARRSGLRVAAQGTGHGAASLGSLVGTRHARPRSVKAAVDPGNLIRSNHPIPPAAPGEEATTPGYSASTPGNRADRLRSSGKA